MKKITLICCLLVALFTSCKIFKANKLASGGSVGQDQFLTEIPFEMKMGLIILKVEIAGQVYNFLLDSGAPNIISTELAQQLKLSNLIGTKATDGGGKQNSLSMVSIDTISIEKINFLNTAAIISPLNLSKELSCLKVDGLIGSNLMRNAVWKIDFKRNIITISNDLNSLKVPAEAAKIPFTVDRMGLPYTDVKINNLTIKDVLFDLGSNGHFNLSDKAIENLLLKSPSLPKLNSYGSSLSGAFGSTKNDSTLFLKVPNFSMGDVLLENLIMREGYSSLIGMEFFKNYTVIFDWSSKQLILLNEKPYQNADYFSFGFVCNKSENELIVTALFENSPATEAAIQLGDQILFINGVNYENFSDNRYCEWLINNPMTDKQEIEITLKRKDKVSTIVLQRENLFK